MPYNVKNPPADLKKRIKKKYPKAGIKDVRQFAHVFNSAYKESGSEEQAFSRAWGVLKKKMKKSSHKILNNIVKLAMILEDADLSEESMELIKLTKKYISR